MLHEIGHTFGMSGASIPASVLAAIPTDLTTLPAYKVGYPVVRESIMNYDSKVYADDDAGEPDCAPHALDVMAVWALYQQLMP